MCLLPRSQPAKTARLEEEAQALGEASFSEMQIQAPRCEQGTFLGSRAIRLDLAQDIFFYDPQGPTGLSFRFVVSAESGTAWFWQEDGRQIQITMFSFCQLVYQRILCTKVKSHWH